MEEKQMLLLNFDGKSIHEIFDIPNERIDVMINMISNSAKKIMNSSEEFSYEFEGKFAVHKGKVLKDLLSNFTDFQEKVLIISYFETFLQELTRLRLAAFV